MELMEVFELLRATLNSVLLEAANYENPLEKLCQVGGMMKPEVVWTAIRLTETNKIRQLNVKMTEKYRKRRRNFEEFTEKTIFDRDSEILILRKNRKKEYGFKLENPVFFEVEHPKKKENLQFLYPKIHFCPCKFFQFAVLTRQTDWICTHLLAMYLTVFLEKSIIIDCNPEISLILRKILIRSVEEVEEKQENQENREKIKKKHYKTRIF